MGTPPTSWLLKYVISWTPPPCKSNLSRNVAPNVRMPIRLSSECFKSNRQNALISHKPLEIISLVVEDVICRIGVLKVRLGVTIGLITTFPLASSTIGVISEYQLASKSKWVRGDLLSSAPISPVGNTTNFSLLYPAMISNTFPSKGSNFVSSVAWSTSSVMWLQMTLLEKSASGNLVRKKCV